MSLFAELKRRKVFKVGAAYLVAGWVLIQVAATVGPQMNLPEWVPRAITFVIALGFPIALVLAWIYDAGPGGIHRDGRLAAAGIDAVASPPAVVPSAIAPAVAEMPIDIPHKSIAVLPFVDLSPAHDQEYFSDGVAEEILNALVKLKDLKVAGRTSSFSFKGRNEDLRNIGKTLSVAHVLEGSVRKHGDKVRITAQLIQTGDGYHLWSEHYDGDLSDVFELQERIARAITRELDVILHGEQRLVPVATANPEAYALYLQATSIFNRREGPRFSEAIVHLERASALDPGFARAYARLASIHALEPIYSPELTDTAPEAVQRAAARASELDPRLAEPHAAIGLSLAQQHRFVESRQAIERALALDPRDVTTVFWAGVISINTGYTALGCAQLDQVLALDPLYPNALLWRGIQCVYAGDLDRAEILLQRCSDVGLLHSGLGLAMVSAARGRMDEAVAQLADGLRVLGAGLPENASLVLARAVYGDATAHARALEMIGRFLATRPRWLPAALPSALLMMDEVPRALNLMREYRTTNDAQYFHVLWSPSLRAARATPEFREITRALGGPDLWDRYGAPDGCHRNAAGEYVWD